MNFPQFFIQRPIFAMVLSIFILIAGILSFYKLPLSEYPSVTPPTVQVIASYPGATPKVIADTVASPIEQAVNGVEGMLYMSSQMSTDGKMVLTISFRQDVDPDIAQVQVQNLVSRVIPRLPQEVQQIGVTTEKTSPDVLMVVHMYSPNNVYDPLFVSNYTLLNVRDEIARLSGVASAIVWGEGEYAMRAWIDPTKIASLGLTPNDIVSAIREQNIQVAAGSIGQQPDSTSSFQMNINVLGRLTTEEQFGKIVVHSGDDGQAIYLKDVARLELGADNYSLRSLLNGQNAVGLQIVMSPGANALEVADSVRKTMSHLQTNFIEGVDYEIAYDPTVFVSASLKSVAITLLEATLLVVIVVVLFLQSWRASVIPLVAVPVSLVGTFAFMYLLGFSLNTLSLFGLVISIGIVVDDAIVVVENVERHIKEGLAPKDAAVKAMNEVTGPIIAITSVLAAVFIPTAFLSGLQGEFYRQFSLTIVISTAISAVNSLTLSPALSAILLKSHGNGSKQDWLTRIINIIFGRFFSIFNSFFNKLSRNYVQVVRRCIRGSLIISVLYLGFVGLTAVGFKVIPNGFVPAQDKYYLIGVAQLPSGASLDRTEAVVKEMSRLALLESGVENVVAFPGLSVNGPVNLPNSALMFVMLKPFDERTDPSLSANAIAERFMGQFSQIPDGFVGIFPPPPVPGLGSMGGFKVQIEDRANLGFDALAKVQEKVLMKAMEFPELTGMMASFQTNSPQIDVDINREKAKAMGVTLTDIFDALQINLGSLYINDFNQFGRTYRVIVQADTPFRMAPRDIELINVRNKHNEMIPLSSLVTIVRTSGPDRIIHYNGYLSVDITGNAAPGFTSKQATDAMEKILHDVLPEGMAFEWTDLTYQEQLAGNSALYIFPLAVLFAFLILAAQYNSWLLPFSVLLIAPMALLSAIAGVWFFDGDNNIFTQIAFIVLVGLAAKNAILIVEFAIAQEKQGKDTLAAIIEAAHLRLRPILMTSFAFIAGVIPLVFATGAGSEMREAVGVAVFFGMLGVTLFGLLLTPIFYIMIRKLVSKKTSP